MDVARILADSKNLGKLAGSPIAVGGVGGSGTRAVAAALQSLGVDLGSDLNDSLDDLGFNLLFKRKVLWPPENHNEELTSSLRLYLANRGLLGQSSDVEAFLNTELSRLFSTLLNEHGWQSKEWIAQRRKAMLQPDVVNSRWGWKEPNTHIVLPFLLQEIPQLKYVHIIRHGLDMAFSSNQNQLWLWGEKVLARPVNQNSSADSFDYWCTVHQRLLNIEDQYPGRIQLLNFEHLWKDPQVVLENLIRFVDLGRVPESRLSQIAKEIQKPTTHKRYRDKPAFDISKKQRQLLSDLGFKCEWETDNPAAVDVGSAD